AAGPWHHDSEHRRGVSYRTAGTPYDGGRRQVPAAEPRQDRQVSAPAQEARGGRDQREKWRNANSQSRIDSGAPRTGIGDRENARRETRDDTASRPSTTQPQIESRNAGNVARPQEAQMARGGNVQPQVESGNARNESRGPADNVAERKNGRAGMLHD